MARVAVELDVGARPKGQASFSTPTSMTMSLVAARLERGFPVKTIKAPPISRTLRTMRFSSWVSPLLEMAMMMSSPGDDAQIAVDPSTGWRNRAGVTGTGQGGGDLFADNPRFADTCHDDPAFGMVDEIYGPSEVVVESLDETQDAFCLQPEHIPGPVYGIVLFHRFASTYQKTAILTSVNPGASGRSQNPFLAKTEETVFPMITWSWTRISSILAAS